MQWGGFKHVISEGLVRESASSPLLVSAKDQFKGHFLSSCMFLSQYISYHHGDKTG